MGTLIQDIRYGIRMLRKHPAITAVAALTLALGIGANTTAFSAVNGLILRPLPVANANRLVVMANVPQSSNNVSTEISYPDFQDVRSQANGFSDVIGYTLRLAGLETGGKAEPILYSYVSGNYFSALGLKPALGRLIYGAETEKNGTEPVAVLGYDYWLKHFGGDQGIVGKQVRMNGHAVTIVGVAPQGFHGTYSIVEMQAYLPMGMRALWDVSADDKNAYWTSRTMRDIKVMAALKPGVSRREAQASLDVVSQRLRQEFPDIHKELNYRIFPEQLSRPEPDPTNGLLIVGILFMVLSVLVLTLACSNVANIVLVRATARERELAVRTALGAARSRVVRQLLTESTLLAFVGGGLGVLISLWATRTMSSVQLEVANIPMRFDFSFDWRVFTFSIVVAVFTGVVVGLAPAWRSARSDFNKVLHQGSRGIVAGRSRMRNMLVVAQVAISLMLLVVAGLFVRSTLNAEHNYLGFDPHNVLNLTMETRTIGYDQPRTQQFLRDLEDRVRALPGVESASLSSIVPMGYSFNAAQVFPEGQSMADKDSAPEVLYSTVTPSYFTTMRIPLLRGRFLTDQDKEKTPRVVVINEALAKKLWPNQDPIGKHFSLKSAAGAMIEVVGVAKQGKYNDPVDSTTLFFYQPLAQNPETFVTLQLRTAGDPHALITETEQAIHDLAPGLPLTDVESMDEALGGVNGFFLYRMGSRFTVILGLLGLVLSLVGVYSVISYAAAQKTHEIGIRMALGADRGDVLTMVLRQGFVLIGAGLVTGLVLAVLAGRGITSLLVGVSPSDPLTLIAVTLLLSLVGLAASLIPARRAMKIEPLRALKYE